MRRLLDITFYPWIIVFLIAGLMTVIFAFASFNLFFEARANLGFLREHGWRAVMEGGLLQLALLALYGLAALMSFVVFRICEGEMVQRYRRWVGKPRD